MEEHAAVGIDLSPDEDVLYWRRRELLESLQDGETGEKRREQFRAWMEYYRIRPDDDLRALLHSLSTGTGDKVLGWPLWTQGVEYPPCPQCGQPMRMVLQINNDGHTSGEPGYQSFFGQLFAGDGNGHVFQCRTHTGVMTFAWACS
jgi:hypothetical protein